MRPATDAARAAGLVGRDGWGPTASVNIGLTSVRRETQVSRRVVENDEYASFAARVVRAHGRRVAAGDVEGLRDLAALDALVQEAIRTAVGGLRAEGFSWAEIGDRLGITRQAAQQRWGTGTASGAGVAS